MIHVTILLVRVYDVCLRCSGRACHIGFHVCMLVTLDPIELTNASREGKTELLVCVLQQWCGSSTEDRKCTTVRTAPGSGGM